MTIHAVQVTGTYGILFKHSDFDRSRGIARDFSRGVTVRVLTRL